MAVKSRLARKRRHRRVRRKISGTAARPRLNVFRSLDHIYAQIIDDTAGHTLAAASTKDSELASAMVGKSKVEQANAVGKALAERAQAAEISTVVFDRGGFIYHGRVKALAEGAREAGLQF
jgi:large subunit ribosomal protein L18